MKENIDKLLERIEDLERGEEILIDEVMRLQSNSEAELGVGDSTGQLFVRGNRESIYALQDKLLKMEKRGNLFIKNQVTLNSGTISDFKIECDALTDSDIDTIAHLIHKMIDFREVTGVPTGGLRLQEALEQYATHSDDLPLLIVDDVLTTGNSMNRFRQLFAEQHVKGVVIFSRTKKVPEWITPLFQLNDQL